MKRLGLPGIIRVVFLCVGLALFVYFLIELGPGRILFMLAGVGWDFFPILGVYSLHQCCRAAALRRCLPAQERPGLLSLLWIRISGEAVQFLTSTGPFLAEPARAWLLKRKGLATESAFAAVIGEFLIYTFASLGLCIGGFLYLMYSFELNPGVFRAARATVIGMTVFLAVSAIAIVFRLHLIGAVLQGISHLPLMRTHFNPDMQEVHRMENILLALLRSPRRVLGVLTLTLAAQALLVLELFTLLRAVGLVFPLLYPVLIESFSKFVATVFFFIPGQLGAAEGTYALAFGIIGLETAAGFTVAFARRLRTLTVAGVGLLALWLLTGDRKKQAG